MASGRIRLVTMGVAAEVDGACGGYR